MTPKDERRIKLYEERQYDLEKVAHKRKMLSADVQLAEARRKVKSARQLYEERAKDL